MNLGATIKRMRSRKGIRQNQLAADAGISPTYLSQIESNQKDPNLSTLKVISDKLSTPLPLLFFMSLDKSDIKPEKQAAFEIIEPAMKSMVIEFFGHDLIEQ